MNYEEAQKKVFEYSELITAEAKKIPFFPISKLPRPEEEIREAIFFLARENKAQEQWVRSLEVFYLYLAHFIVDQDFAKFCELVVEQKSEDEKDDRDFTAVLESNPELKAFWDVLNKRIQKEREARKEEFQKNLSLAN